MSKYGYMNYKIMIQVAYLLSFGKIVVKYHESHIIMH